ncbi:unnamed protein product [Closterium sp. NIES-65]|nr:unnamed protein product [Closterium sp. NIES-65]
MAVTLPNRGYDLRTSSLRRRQCTLPCHIIALLAYASFLAAPSRAAPSPYLPVEARNQLLLPGASSSHHGGFPGAHLPARREDLSLKINYTNVYMFCYRETYARMPPTKKCAKRFRGIGPMCLPQQSISTAPVPPHPSPPPFPFPFPTSTYPPWPPYVIACISLTSPSSTAPVRVHTQLPGASSITFLTYKVKLPAIDPYIDPAFKISKQLSKWWKKIFPPMLSHLKKRSDFNNIAQKTIASRTLTALFIASYAKPAQGNDRSTITFVDPGTEDKEAALKEFKNSHYVISEHAFKTGKGLVGTLGFLDFTINLENAAKLDPSGVIDFMLQFGHMPCGKGHGFAPAPMATNFPFGETLEYQYPVKAVDCLKLCKVNTKCALAVTTWGNECWLKSSIGDPVTAETYQAFKKL